MNVAGRYHSPFFKQGPPALLPDKPTEAEPAPELQKALVSGDSEAVSWGRVALGAGMALGTLVGMTQSAGAAPPPVEAHFEAPEVVVMSQSIERIDLVRETEEVCETDFDGEEECHDEDVAYHPVGVHAGEGVVRDLNGNLFVAPQLVADAAPGVAVINPGSVEVRGPLGSRGRLTRDRHGDYETSGGLFGYHSLDVEENQIEIGERGLWGSSWRAEVTNRGESVRINERWDTDHTLTTDGVESELSEDGWLGGYTVTLRHQPGRTNVTFPGFITDSHVTVEYDANSLERRDNGWFTSEIVHRGGEHAVKKGSIISTTVSETERTGDGWSDSTGDFFSASYRYRVTGGEFRPRN